MIRFARGDIFAADCEALVNPVNCVGVMGAGLAQEVRRRFPDACKPYFERCERGDLHPGGLVVVYRGRGLDTGPRWLVHIATKMHWRQPSRLAYVGNGLDELATFCRTFGIGSVAVPALGCGLGGLDWKHVRQQMEAFLGDVENVEFVVFEPGGKA